MKPHLVKEVENPITHNLRLTVPQIGTQLNVSQSDIDFVKQAMVGVTTDPSGTAYAVFRGAPYVAGGKTGTAQVYSLEGAKYEAHAVTEEHRDHALFTAFAPADHPSIALALVVEHGGWGAQAAGPIARKVLDYWLIDRLKPGAEAAAIAAAASAASAAEVSDGPVIGGAETPLQAALPASVSASSKAFELQPASGAQPDAQSDTAGSESKGTTETPTDRPDAAQPPAKTPAKVAQPAAHPAPQHPAPTPQRPEPAPASAPPPAAPGPKPSQVSPDVSRPTGADD